MERLFNDTSDEESGKYSRYCRQNIAFTYLQNDYFRLNIICCNSALLRSTECADEEAWHVVAEYATNQRRAMDTVDIVDDIWNKTAEFIHLAGRFMQHEHIGNYDDLMSFKSLMGDNSDSDDPIKFEAFDSIRAAIPYSPLSQELRRKGNSECFYRRKFRGI
jgi:hypothetical protein